MRFNFVIGLVFILLLCGCTMMIIGASALSGYAVSRDTIGGEFDKSFDSVYDVALNISETMGVIESKSRNSNFGKIRAKVENSSLDIYVEKLTAKAVRLRVKSRKNLLPNIELAQKVYNQILQEAI